jgi:predicted outer membrane protein
LSEKQGVEFDKAYMGQQVSAHMAMLAELKASQKYAGQELQPVIQEGTQMTQQDLEQAKKIMEQIKDVEATAGATGDSQRATATPPRR